MLHLNYYIKPICLRSEFKETFSLLKWYVLPYFIVSSLDNKIKNFQFTGKYVINPYIKEVYHAPFSLLSVRRIPVVYHDFPTGGGGGGGDVHVPRLGDV